MMRRNSRFLMLLVFIGFGLFGSNALAIPYASAVRNTGGTNWEFVLNEAADIVTINRDGGNPVVINNAAIGRHTFDMTGFTNFEIAVSKAAPTAWTELSSTSNVFTRFERPAGLVVNKNPASPYFGTVYVAQATNLSVSVNGSRTMAEGIYPLTADLTGVNLTNFSVISDPQDTTQSKKPAAWVTDDTLTPTNTATTDNARSPWRIALDQAGNLIVADWSINTGGLKWASPNLTSGGPLLAIQDGEEPATFPVRNSNEDDLHSRIQSQMYVTGSIGNNLTVTGIDSQLRDIADPPTTNQRNVWRWNIGNHDFTANPNGYDGTNMPPQSDFIVPEMIINGSRLNRVHEPAQTMVSGGTEQWFHNIPAVLGDSYYSPQHELFYLTQPRSNGDQASLLIVDPNLGADPTGNTPIVLFNSREWTRDHGMDGAIGQDPLGGVAPETGRAGEDVFRMAGQVELSPDGTKMFLRRQQVIGTAGGTSTNENPVLGPTSNNGFSVLVIPLDANGLPVLEINNMGTPADTTDDRISNLTGFNTLGAGQAPANHEIELDVAGNVYTTHSSQEVLQVFSPGGNWTATTTSSGMFSLTPFTPPFPAIAGDYNDNGTVDAADYVLWRKLLGTNTQLENEGNGVTPGMVTQEDYNTWRANFGKTPGAGTVLASVPEPAAGIFAALAVGVVFAVPSRRRGRG
jgi:hypothetical protein